MAEGEGQKVKSGRPHFELVMASLNPWLCHLTSQPSPATLETCGTSQFRDIETISIRLCSLVNVAVRSLGLANAVMQDMIAWS